MSFYTEAIKLLDNKDIEVVSFDFFDTLVYRNVEDPKDIFSILGMRLLDKGLMPANLSPERFQLNRVEAEIRARKKTKQKEVRLIDIYKELPFADKNVKLSALVRAEIDIESENIRPLYTTLTLLAAAKKMGKKIVVVSDTYFASEDLSELLPKKFSNLIDKFYCSSELNVGKGSGSFNYLINDLKLSPEKILHFGDNYVADVEIPTKLGIVALLLPNGTNELAEIRSREFELFTRKNSNFPIGPMSHRVTQEIKIAHFMDISKPWGYEAYGLYVLGPIFTAFCKWASERVQLQRYDAVFAVMREGFLIEKLIKILFPKIKGLSKVYLSRKILFKASLHKIGKNDIFFAFANPMAKNLKGSADLINLSLEEFLNLMNVATASEGAKFSAEDIFQKISSNRKIQSLISSRAKELRGKLLSHLSESAGSMELKKIALLDLGWNTTIQALLYKCLEVEGFNASIDGFYLMTTRAANSYEIYERNNSMGFLVNGGFPEVDYAILSRNLEILEQSCCPDHGSVIDYGEDGKPMVASSQLSPDQISAVKSIQDGIQMFAKFYASNNPEVSPFTFEYLEYLRCKLIRAMINPTPNEVRLFEAWQHDDNLFNHDLRRLFNDEYAKQLEFKSLEALVGTPMTEAYWPAGAIAKYDQSISKILLYAAVANLDLSPFSQKISGQSFGFLVGMSDGEDRIEDCGDFQLTHQSKCSIGVDLFEYAEKNMNYFEFSLPRNFRGGIIDSILFVIEESGVLISHDLSAACQYASDSASSISYLAGDYIRSGSVVRVNLPKLERKISAAKVTINICGVPA